MNRCAAAGFTSSERPREYASSFSRAEASASGSPWTRAPVSSAPYSRAREIASWMIVAAIGAMMIEASRASGLVPS